MDQASSDNPLNGSLVKCAACGREIPAGEAYRLGSRLLCEDCGLVEQTHPVRKTHWHYIRSIKDQYIHTKE